MFTRDFIAFGSSGHVVVHIMLSILVVLHDLRQVITYGSRYARHCPTSKYLRCTILMGKFNILGSFLQQTNKKMVF